MSNILSGNAPAFYATMGTTQVMSAGATTKFILNTEIYDTNNNYDPTTNYRFTPTVAGYYQINFVCFASQASNLNTRYIISLYKNGTAFQRVISYNNTSGDYQGICLSTIVSMNGSTDYLEMYGNPSSQTLSFFASATAPYDNVFSGALILGQ
jgi:hypothetical protein